MFERWGRTVVRRRWWVIGAALAFMAFGGIWGTQVFGALITEGFDDPHSESACAAVRAEQTLGRTGNDVVVLYRSPTTTVLRGRSIANEVDALRRRGVWLIVAVAALGISSIFAVYTFIGPFVTDAAQRDAALIPVALAVFGIGMAVGNHVGGRVADRHEHRGLVWAMAGHWSSWW